MKKKIDNNLGISKVMITGFKIYPIYFGGTEIGIYEISTRLNSFFDLKLSLSEISEEDSKSEILKELKILPVSDRRIRSWHQINHTVNILMPL